MTDIVKDASLFLFNRYLQIGGKNKMVNVRKRGNVYEYNFDVAKIEGKRKRITKSGFKTKAEALKQGTIAYNEYLNTGRKFVYNEMSYSDFLDYWLDNHCKINLKYHTIEAYSNIVKTHLKPNLGFYKLSQITKPTLQDFLNKIRILLPVESLMMKYNQIASELLKQQDLLRKMNVNIAAQRDILIHRLMSGKLEV